jgi:predicted component of type VI protein secretion system
MESDESPVTSGDKPVLLVMLPEGGQERHPLEARETTIGRDPANNVCISDHFVSSFHAKIVRSGGTFSVVDLGSANKTRVNGRAVVQRAVKSGDEIHFAGVLCRLEAPKGLSDDFRETDGPSIRSTTKPPSAASRRKSNAATWKPPVPKLRLSMGVLVLFAVVAALTTQVC